MTETKPSVIKEMIAMNAKLDEALKKSTREDLLEHARMGRSICEGRGSGKVVWITPVEIFARYGLDEFGREKPQS